ncbi:von Willebrand factor, type A [Phytophthora cactorum]|nr:von Willebrand factor, type A [Phytophthora cactorum]
MSMLRLLLQQTLRTHGSSRYLSWRHAADIFHCKGNDIDVEDRKYKVAREVLLKCVTCFVPKWVVDISTICRVKAMACDAPKHHELDSSTSYCVLDAWHLPEVKPEVDDGFAYIDGHKFECVHAVDSGKFHSIFVLDSSGSMHGQPWTNLLYACNEFTINRLNDGGGSDLVSYVTFDNNSHIHCEAKTLKESVGIKIPFSGGGTCFQQGCLWLTRSCHATVLSSSRPRSVSSRMAIRTISRRGSLLRNTFAPITPSTLEVFVVGFGHVNLSVLSAWRPRWERIAAVLRKNEASLALMEA